MNKREFIKVLEEKLNILEESELRDIINEYRDTIDEKVKHGKTEAEAVSDFGSVDELVKEILQAYKINPKHVNSKSTAKEAAESFESFVKKGAQSLADFSREVFEDFKNNNKPLTIELIFEILIKSIILLIIFAVLRLPFTVIGHLGQSILEVAFFPLDSILLFIWGVIVWCLYITVCVLIAIAMFKQVINIGGNVDKKEDVKKVKKEKINEDIDKKVVKVEKEEKKISEDFFTRGKDENIEKRVSSSGFGVILSGIFKAFIVVFCLIPLWFIDLIVFTLLVASIYYLFIGINTYGLIILFIGFAIAVVYLSKIFYNIAFNRKKIYFIPFIVSLCFVVLGGLLTADMVTKIEYIDTAPKVNYDKKTERFEFELEENEKVSISNWYYDFKKEVDNDIADGKFVVEVTYYDRLVDYMYVNKNKNYIDEENIEYPSMIDIYYDHNYGFQPSFTLYNLFVNNLKKNKVYDYEKMFRFEVVVYANGDTLELIK